MNVFVTKKSTAIHYKAFFRLCYFDCHNCFSSKLITGGYKMNAAEELKSTVFTLFDLCWYPANDPRVRDNIRPDPVIRIPPSKFQVAEFRFQLCEQWSGRPRDVHRILERHTRYDVTSLETSHMMFSIVAECREVKTRSIRNGSRQVVVDMIRVWRFQYFCRLSFHHPLTLFCWPSRANSFILTWSHLIFSTFIIYLYFFFPVI